MRARHALVASCVLTILTVAACSGGSTAGQELSWEDSPLEKAMADFWGADQDEESMMREENERMRAMEEAVAACMAEQGFEYIPVDHAMGADIVNVVEDEEDTETAEWAQQYGYGVTTEPWADEAPSVEEEWVDPNEDYVNAMSPSEQEAYFAALHGEPVFADEEEWVEGEDVPVEEYSWEEAGCYGEAQHEVYDDDAGADMWEDPAYTEFFAAVERLYEEAQSDPRVQEINDEWAACMADAGIPGMTRPDEAAMAFYEEFDSLYMKADEQIDWESVDWEALEGDGADPVRELMEDMGLAELREREIATAVADRACQEELDVQNRTLRVHFELEEEFVETYQADIDSLIATYGEKA